MEFIDLVDEHDRVIGTVSRDESEAKRLLHRSVSLLVFEDNTHTRVLLQKRSRTKNVCPGRYCLPGGHVLAAETYLHAARREFSEEHLGGKVVPDTTVFEKLFTTYKDTDGHPGFVTAYRAIHPHIGTSNVEEISDTAFVDISDLFDRVEREPSEFTELSVFILRTYRPMHL